MEWAALLIPIVAGVVLHLVVRRRVTWWEAAIPVLPVILIVPLVRFGAEAIATRDTERHGGWCAEARYYEDWDEWVKRTCTRQVPNGTDGKGHTRYRTVTYDCSYRQYHPARWELTDSNGYKLSITQAEFEVLAKRFASRQFVELNRRYYHDDGDMYVTKWPGSDATLQPVFTEHAYENRVQATKGVLDFPEVDDPSQLHKYPPLRNALYDPAILGEATGKAEADRRLQFYNAKRGRAKEIRCWVLLFNGKPRRTGHQQESYWKGGNKNELVVCIGVGQDGTVEWCHPFCWSPDGYAGNDTLRIRIRDHVEGKKLDLPAAVDYMTAQADELYKRKNFDEFAYLRIETPTWAVWLVYVLTILATGGTGAFVVLNGVGESDEG